MNYFKYIYDYIYLFILVNIKKFYYYFNYFKKNNSILTLDGLLYIRGFILIIILDSLIIDDEPLWEPVEWSLVQTWLLFIFMFSWATEVIFSSRYGSYTNRDKKVWLGLYKTYWLLELWTMFNIFIVTVFITLPFYFEITYSVSYIILWWNWYNTIFFFKFISLFSLILIMLNLSLLNFRWVNYQFFYIPFLIVLIILIFFFFFQFFSIFFAYFTDIIDYKYKGWLDFNKLTTGPLKWGWGSAARDHFSYHKTPTVFWIKNDPLIVLSMLFINFFIFFSLFFLILKTLIVLRILYITHQLSYNTLIFFINSIKQFYYFLLYMVVFVFMSILYQLIRFPFDFYWFVKLINLFKLWFLIIFDFYLFFITLF
jgi:hypothetical protein